MEEDLCEAADVEREDGAVRGGPDALMPRPTAYIFGGGRVGTDVARIAPIAGFRLVVVDDREEFADRARFPAAGDVRTVGFSRAFEGLDIDDFSYILVTTRGHRSDREVVARALRTDAAYIGMIGSRRKVALDFEALKREGFTDVDLRRVHAPIGLPIGGDTPGEIAVGVVAEMIRVRRLGEPERRPERQPELRATKGAPVPWDVILSGCR